MKLVVPIHLWFSRVRRAICDWFDFGCDLSGLNLDDEEVNLDLACGRE